MSKFLSRALFVALIAILYGPSAAVAKPTHAEGAARFFHSPSGNIGCELDWQRAGVTNAAFCQTYEPARSVRLSANGALRVCSGDGCIGDGPEDAFALSYGNTTALGPFRCLSATSGMRCTVASGLGFELSRAGVRRLAGPVSAPLPTAGPLAGAVYKPSGSWCPTNRTCFSRGVAWESYGRTQAVGVGVAKSCETGTSNCTVTRITIVLSAPKVACGKLRFTRLTMYGNHFTYYCGGSVYV